VTRKCDRLVDVSRLPVAENQDLLFRSTRHGESHETYFTRKIIG
jgi:hypothetical protein